ncbi:MAG: arginase family protein, partial [Chloroflexota bacterium]
STVAYRPPVLVCKSVFRSVHQTLPGPIVGADVVELNPHRDLVDMTAMVAAKFTKELLARMLEE